MSKVICSKSNYRPTALASIVSKVICSKSNYRPIALASIVSKVICRKSNYRPIALASIVSKVFEKLIYDRIAYNLTTCSNQFGFKTKHSTDICIYAFKEAVLKYRSLNNVYSCFFIHPKHLIV